MGFGSSDISFLAALLFAFNPANNQASVWISGRSYANSALGMTGAMALPMISPIFLFIAAHYNPGFISPAIFAGSKFWWFLAFMPLIWMFHMKHFHNNVQYKMKAEMFAEDKMIKPEKFVLFLKTFGFYLALGLVPFKNTFYHSFLQSAAGSGKDKAYTMKDRFFFIGVAGAAAIVAYLIMHPWDWANFALLWWAFCIAPFCNFFRIHQEIAERYMYLPNVGLMYFLASIFAGNHLLSAVFLTMYATRLWFYMDAYRDDFYLTESASLNSPESWFGWHVKAMKRWDAKSHQEAVIYWTMARNISPKEFKINLNIASALRLSSDPKHHVEAEKFLAIAAANVPGGQEAQADHIISEWKKGNVTIVL